MIQTKLTIGSKNYSSWSLRGWLMLKLSGLPFEEVPLVTHHVDSSAELLLLSPPPLVPGFEHNNVRMWGTLSIGEYLHEIAPEAELLPTNPVLRAHCRSICGEMHSGFSAIRASLPMNIKGHFKKTKVWSTAQHDIDRVCARLRDCIESYKGPFLFGNKPTLADCMFAPLVTGFITYSIELDPVCEAYCQQILSMPEMREWIEAATAEHDRVEDFELAPQEQFSFSTYNPAVHQTGIETTTKKVGSTF